MEDTYKDLEKLVDKELKGLINKGSLSPTELDTAKKAVCLLKMLEDDYDMEEMAEDREYSEASYNRRGMNNSYRTSRGMRRSYGPYRDWNEEMSYYPYPMYDRSYARGRDAATGRYVSREGGRSYNRSYGRGGRMSYGYGPEDEYMAGRRMVVSYGDDGYSGHSIDDRIVDALEHMMDQAASDYEREKLNQVIRFVDSKRGQ